MRLWCTLLLGSLLTGCFSLKPASLGDPGGRKIYNTEKIALAPLDLKSPLDRVGTAFQKGSPPLTDEEFNPLLEDLPDAEYPEEPEEEGTEEEPGFPLPQTTPSPPARGILGEKEFDELLQQEHPYIERWIEFFTQTEKGRSFFSRSLERMALYGPHIARWLEENGLPSKLVWLAFIESGLNPHALSRARAKGIWQFIRSTGKRYNLRRNAYLDERSDPYLSTVAASRYLRDLYLSYRSWELALAAYNAGERRIDRASRKAGHNDYWQMLHHPHRLLPRETKHYVPKMIAAYRIGTDLERYGFSLTSPPSPLTWETISVPGGISLAELSRRVGIPEDLLIGLNPALRRRMTPPGGSYPLRVPPGQGEEMLRVAVTLPALNAPLPFSEDHYIVYRVKRGDTLWKISRRFGIPISAIRDENDLQTSRLRPGQTLYLPKAGGRPLTARKTDTYIRASGEIRYRVQKGDTLWTIAKRFGVPLKDLIRHNQLDPRKPLPVGHLIRIPPFSES